ncbi:MAG: FG-GAP-like repeat-containing protein [Planctomycetota bacterium]|nr:FG-GAP-like repeat-containing protein [Planctomycetota bacterium]
MRSAKTRLIGALSFLLSSIPAAADPPTYVESSAGLDQPGMEAGGTELEFGDVDGDGHVDLVCVGDHGSPFVNTDEHGVMVWFGDGDGAWSLFQYGNFGYGGLALGDANNDNLMDVGYGIHHDWSSNDLGDQILEVALGDGTGQLWSAWDDGLATNGETWGMFGCDFADVDHDGDLDLGSISFGSGNGVRIYRNNGDGSWTQAFAAPGGNSSLEFAFGDLNGDGHPDYAAGHDGGTVRLGDGEGGFTPADGDLPFGPWRTGTSLGDVNGDGRDDLAFCTNTGVAVFTWTAPGEWVDLSGSLSAIGDVALTGIADMNLDGHGDVIALSEPHTRIYAGDGAGKWQLMATIPHALDPCDYAALRAGTDVDHNGYPDLAYIVEEDCDWWTGGTNTPHLWKEASAPAEPLIHPRRPRGGETIIAGSVCFIDWSAAVPAGSPQPTMAIELSVSGPDGPFEMVASSVPDNGRYQWHAPADLPSSDECHVRLTLSTEPPTVGVTPAPFVIVNLDGIPGDVNGDGIVDTADLLLLLASWGPCPDPPEDCPADFDGDDVVNTADLLILLSHWGEAS